MQLFRGIAFLTVTLASLLAPSVVQSESGSGSGSGSAYSGWSGLFGSQDPNEEDRTTVKVFGDPHIITYEGDFQTCSSVGWTNYLTNSYVNFTAYNDYVNDDTEATFVTEMFITVYDGSSNIVAVYNASNASLPALFLYESSDSDVEIEDLGNNKIRIVSENGGLAVTVGEFWSTYSVVLRLADSVFAGSTGVLYLGCPEDEMLDTDTDPTRRKRSVDCSPCNDYEDQVSFESCRYDCNEVGDVTYALDVQDGLQELTEATEEMDVMLVHAQTDDDDEDNSGVSLMNTSAMVMISAVALFLLLLF